MLKKIAFIPFLFLSYLLVGQQIILDENFADWDPLTPAHSDALNDAPFLGLDLGKLWIDNDDEYLYISFETGTRLILQDPNELSIHIDIDNNSATGMGVGDIGADLSYDFGDHEGTVFLANGNSYFVDHFDIGFVSLPTVSSDRFEMKFNLNLYANGNQITMGSNIKVVIKDGVNNGDRLPDGQSGVNYSMDDKAQELPNYSLEKQSDNQLRILSYNVKRDNYFKSGSREAIQRILSATNPDIIAFQEIYDNGASATADQVAQVLTANNGWYHAKVDPDVIMVSRYPITNFTQIANNGNGAFLIDKDGKEILFINVHLPCCDNNAGRIQEVSNIVSFIEQSKAGNTAIDLNPGTAIVFLGDTNFVGFSEQVALAQNGTNGDLDWGQALTDAKPLTTGEPQTFTWYNPFSEFCPGRLDYILYSKSLLTKRNNFALFTESLSDNELSTYGLIRSDTGVASDHLPVFCDFNMSPTVDTKDLSAAENILIYPNPSKGFFRVKNLINEQGALQIYRNDGSFIADYKQLKENAFISTEGFPAGMYILRFTLADQTVIKRLLID